MSILLCLGKLSAARQDQRDQKLLGAKLTPIPVPAGRNEFPQAAIETTPASTGGQITGSQQLNLKEKRSAAMESIALLLKMV